MGVDESTGKMDYMQVPVNEVKAIKVEKVKKPTMWPCGICGKQTKSHRYPDGAVLCHGCFTTMTGEEHDGFTKAHSNRTSKEEEHSV